MKNIAIVGLLFLLSFDGNTSAGERTLEQIQAVKSFKFEGLGLASTPRELQGKRHVLVQPFEPKVLDGAVTYAITPKTAMLCSLTSLKGKNYEMGIMWSPSQIREIGGDSVLIRRLVGKFGAPDDESVVEIDGNDVRLLTWNFQSEKMKVVLSTEKRCTNLIIFDTEIKGLVDRKIEDSKDVGF